MSAPKFTPGPWRIKHSDKRRKVLACDVLDSEYRFFLVLSALLAGCLREHWGRNG